MNETKITSPTLSERSDKSDWIRRSVLFWSSQSESRNESPFDDQAQTVLENKASLTSSSVSSISSKDSTPDSLLVECRKKAGYDPSLLLQQVEEFEESLRTYSSNLSLSCDDTLDRNSITSPHMTLEFPQGSAIKSNPIFTNTENDNINVNENTVVGNKNMNSYLEGLTLTDDKYHLFERLHVEFDEFSNITTPSRSSSRADHQHIEESIKLVQQTLDEITKTINNKEMKFKRDPNEVLRNLLLKIKPPDQNEDDNTRPSSSRADCMSPNQTCDDLLENINEMIEFKEDRKYTEVDKFPVLHQENDPRDRLDSGLQSISSDSNSPYPSPVSQRPNPLRHIQEEYDSGFSDMTRLKTDLKKMTNRLSDKYTFHDNEFAMDRDYDSDWSPISTLSSTYNSKTSTMERGRSYSVPGMSILKAATSSRHRMSTGRIDGHIIRKSLQSTELLYNENELEAIRKFLSLTSQYFEKDSDKADGLSSTSQDDLVIAIPSIQESIEKQKKELDEQRQKQEDFLHQLGDMLLEIVTLKEEHTTVRTKQAKALGLLKRQLDIHKKTQNKAHNDVLNQVSNLKEKLDQSSEFLPSSPKPSKFNFPAPTSPARGLSCSRSNGQLIWRVSDVMKKLTRIKSGLHEEILVSQPFHTSEYGYKMSAWLYLNGRGKMINKYLSIYVCVVVGDYDPILTWPIKPTYTFTLLDQRSDINKRTDHFRFRRVMDIASKGCNIIAKQGGIPRPTNSSKALIVGFDDFIEHKNLLDHHYLMDDTLFISIDANIE